MEQKLKRIRIVLYVLAVGFVAVPMAIAMNSAWKASEMQALLFLDILAPGCFLLAQGLRIREKKQNGEPIFTNICVCLGVLVAVLPQIVTVLSQK